MKDMNAKKDLNVTPAEAERIRLDGLLALRRWQEQNPDQRAVLALTIGDVKSMKDLDSAAYQVCAMGRKAYLTLAVLQAWTDGLGVDDIFDMAAALVKAKRKIEAGTGKSDIENSKPIENSKTSEPC